jgi:hypothetical protein
MSSPENEAAHEKKFIKKVDVSTCNTINNGKKNPRNNKTTPIQINLTGSTLSRII